MTPIKQSRSLVSFLVGLTLTGCLSSSTSSVLSSSSSSSIPPVAVDTPYEDLYQSGAANYVESVPVMGTQKASYGYLSNAQQGHNRWWYRQFDGTTYSDVPHTGTQFHNDHVTLAGLQLQGSATHDAVRTYQVPQGGTGTAFITGRVALDASSTTTAEVRIFHNSVQVYPASGSQSLAVGDTTGFYHEIQLNLQSGDEVNFHVKGTGVVNWNPTIQYDFIRETPLHYNPEGRFANNNPIDIGDVHPYYHDGKMFMYYLKTDGGYNTALATSTNMLSYQEANVTTHPVNPPNSNYYVLGITQEGDTFRTYYGASRDYIYGAKSSDLMVWEAGEGVDNMFNTTHLPTVEYAGGGRDPYVFFDPDVQRYRIIYLAYHNNKYWTGGTDFDAALSLKTSTDATTTFWQTEEKELLRFDNAGSSGRDEPEVPMMVKIGNRWYIFASIYGRTGHGVGAPSYWMGDANTPIDQVNWSSKPEMFLDGEDLCAAQLVQVGTRWYIYGWLPPFAGGGGWGGALNIAREVYADPDGTLKTRLDPYITNLLNGGSLYRFSQGNTTSVYGDWNVSTSGATFTGNGYNFSSLNMSQYGELKLPQTYRQTLVQFDVDLSSTTKTAGIKVMQEGGSEFATISLDPRNQRLVAAVRSQGGYLTRSTYAVSLPLNQTYQVKAIIVGAFVEFFVNDQYALSARLFNDDSRNYLSNYAISLFSDGYNTAFNNLQVNMLRTAETAFDEVQ